MEQEKKCHQAIAGSVPLTVRASEADKSLYPVWMIVFASLQAQQRRLRLSVLSQPAERIWRTGDALYRAVLALDCVTMFIGGQWETEAKH